VLNFPKIPRLKEGKSTCLGNMWETVFGKLPFLGAEARFLAQRKRIQIRCPRGREGSSPSAGTPFFAVQNAPERR
jgi:hypothetical protein